MSDQTKQIVDIMDQRINFITLGVQHIDEMTAFYRDVFGWSTLKEGEGITFFKLNGCILGLYPADDLAADVGVSNDGKGFRRVTLAINFNSIQEVDAAFAQVQKTGARVVKPAQSVFWGGYSGYVADPEDNYWELAYNPFLEMDEQGNVVTHK